MTTLARETELPVRMAVPTIDVCIRRLLQAFNSFSGRVTKILALLVLGTICTLSSIIFLLSLGVAMPVLTEQFGTWIETGRWAAVPLSMILTRMGYSPQLDEAPIPTAIDWLLSNETGLLIVLSAGIFGCTLWLFEIARSRSCV